MTNKKIKKVLVANRGEIALRILRSLKKLDIKSLAIYSQADADALFVSEADEAWLLGDGTISETYLNIPKIIQIAKNAGADGVHPGYGFLSENPLLAQACIDNGLIFIGPSAHAITLMGNKIEARKMAVDNGLPVTRGLTGSVEDLLAKADQIPFPVLVKAAAGGGGKGMRIVRKKEELTDIIQSTSREANNYFGDGTVYIEQYLEEPRHIEIQVLGDQHGHVVHLFERECSIQRRYQKIIEESPSPSITNELRHEMGAAAVKLCKAIGYYSAGTIEFLVDQNMKFYFLEMNTRIQVEHPVTEMVTGIDLVEAQIKIAQGDPLSLSQNDIRQNGHAIECRIYAEDPEENFRPSPGFIHLYQQPAMKGLRIDSSMNRPTEVLSLYDPMISKLVAYAENRNNAINKAIEALQQYAIHGIQTNIPFLLALLNRPEFRDNQLSTSYCDSKLGNIIEDISNEKSKADPMALVAAFLIFDLDIANRGREHNVWKNIGYWRHHMSMHVMTGATEAVVELKQISDDCIVFSVNQQRFETRLFSLHDGKLVFRLNGQLHQCFVSVNSFSKVIVQYNGLQYLCSGSGKLHIGKYEDAADASGDAGNLFAPMPGKVIQINVKEGQEVNRGMVLIVVEAMKMENNILSPMDGMVEKLNVAIGDMVDTKMQLIHLLASNQN